MTHAVIIILLIVALIHQGRLHHSLSGVFKLLRQIKKLRSHKIILTISTNNSKTKGDIMSFKLMNATANVEIKPVDADGNEQPYQANSESYSSSNEAVFTVSKDTTNPKLAVITRVGAGLGQLTITVDPNPADEITEILSKSVDIEVPAPEDTNIIVKIDGAEVS